MIFEFTNVKGLLDKLLKNEEQIISGCPIDGAISVRVDGASCILILHCGPPEPPQRHLYC